MGETVTFPEFESYLEAEAEARRRTVAYVVVEVRDEHDAPGVEALFAVCSADEVNQVPRGREIVFTAEIPCSSLGLARSAMQDSLRWAERAVQRQGEPMELLAAIHNSLALGLEKTSSAAGQGR